MPTYTLNQWTKQVKFDQRISIELCPTCHIPHGIPTELRERMLLYNSAQYPNNYAKAYCPNGHDWWYIGKTAEQQRLEQTERELKIARDQRDSARTAGEQARRHAAAMKGQVTKIRNRIRAGICPVQSCRANLGDRVRDHIAHEHPDFALPAEVPA